MMNRKYAFEPNKLKEGSNQLSFEIDRSFFAEFEHSLVEEGKVKIEAEIVKFKTHMDVTLQFEGELQLNCDRCLEPYPYHFETEKRLIFAYEARKSVANAEVIIIDRNEQWIDLSKEFYDFIHLEIPLRKVPEPEIHLCDENILNLLGLDESGEEDFSGEEESPEAEEAAIDPRWAALKNLKFDKNQ